MQGVLNGFATIGIVIAVGALVLVAKGAPDKHLSPADKPIEIGVLAVGTGTDAIMEVWLKSTGSRNRLTITELSFKRFVGAEYPVWEDVADLIRVEPAGIVYPEVIADGSADIEALQTFIAQEPFRSAVRLRPHAARREQSRSERSASDGSSALLEKTITKRLIKQSFDF